MIKGSKGLSFCGRKKTGMWIPGEASLEVKVYDNDVEKALKVLKNKLAKSGILKELKARKYYEKPSVKKKRKAKINRHKRKKRRRKNRHKKRLWQA